MATGGSACFIEPINDDTNVQQWMQRFESICLLQEYDDTKKKNALLAWIGPKTYGLLAEALLPKAPADYDYNKLKAETLSQLQNKKPVLASRFNFNKILQGEDSIRAFVRKLRAAAESCQFGNNADERIRDQLVFGLQNRDLLRRMLTEDSATLTLEGAITIATAYESVTKSQHDFIDNSTREVFAVHKRNMRHNATHVDQRTSKVYYRDMQCQCCGRHGHQTRDCRKKKSSCFKCGKMGHLQSCCPITQDQDSSRSRSPRRKEYSRSRSSQRYVRKFSVANASSNSSNNSSRGSFTPVRSAVESQIKAIDNKQLNDCDDTLNDDDYIMTIGRGKFVKKVLINGTKVNMIFDTGAEISLINEDTLKKVAANKDVEILKTKRRLRAYGGAPIDVIGEVMVNVKDGNGEANAILMVVNGQDSCIFGADLIKLMMPSFSIDVISNYFVSLQLKENFRPVFLRARTLPYGIRNAVKDEISRLVKEGVLVSVSESDWATPIVPVRKSDGSIRICGDYKITLNPQLSEMISTTPLMEDVVNNMTGSRVFSEIDLRNAYHQLPLDSQSSILTTISTMFGLYRYTSLPFGVKQAPALFQQVIDRILVGIKGVEIYQDNVYVHASTEVEHEKRLQNVLKALEVHGVCINHAKCKFSVNRINVLGTVVDGCTIKPDESKIAALKSFKVPRNVAELRSFLGLVEFYAKYVPNLATIKEPLTRLLKKHAKFAWTIEQQNAFKVIEDILCEEVMLCAYDPKKSLSLHCDASPVGVGAVLEQEGTPILFISKTLSSAERGYAQIEREALAIVWAIKRLHKYLYGNRFTLYCDNRPLCHIFSPEKSLSATVAGRLQRWAIFLMGYCYTIKNVSSRENMVADALSRHVEMEKSCKTFDVRSINYSAGAGINMESIRKEYARDSTMQSLLKYIRSGWPSEHKLQKFRNDKHNYSIENGLIYKGLRLVIPYALRSEILKELHRGHIGRDKMKSIARQSVWWPEMDANIEHMYRSCEQCSISKLSNKSDWRAWPEPERKWQRCHIDYAGPFENGQYALVIVDAFSKWPEVHLGNSCSTEQSIARLRRTFAQEGIPEVIVSDNGPQFTSKEMERWLQSIGCRHVFTPPYHPKSNGLAERFVRTLKEHVRACSGENNLQLVVDQFLLQYRNSRHSSTGIAPAVIMRGGLLRNVVTALSLSEQNRSVWIRKYNDKSALWEAAEIVGREGSRIYSTKKGDGEITRRHVEQMKPRVTDEEEHDCNDNEHNGELQNTNGELQNQEPNKKISPPRIRPRREIIPPRRYGFVSHD